MFVGRKREIKLLDEAYHSGKSELVVIYGRRRIGKSSMVDRFAQDKKNFFKFEAVEGENTPGQISHFTELLKNQVNDPLLESVNFKSWEQVFNYVNEKIVSPASRKGKVVLFLDELQWMAARRGKLVSLLKYWWDNHWKAKRVMLILCGSVASFMVKRVLRSKALYGRITLEILLKGLAPDEAALLFRDKRSKEEILKYMLLFGGVPKYLEEINLNRSFHWNINRMCFSSYSTMTKEVERIFYSQFREVQTYERIVYLLRDGIFSFNEISRRLKIPSGGGLKLYLENLEQAEFIRSFVPFDKSYKSKLKKYSMADEYLFFYFKYIEPNLRIIEESVSQKLFETLTGDGFDPWLGFAFERFCIKHAGFLARRMGFAEYVLLYGPYFGREDERFQVDLLYKRSDKVICLCEIKYRKGAIGTDIIPGMERKCALLKAPRGWAVEKALISLHGPDKPLKDSGYFDYHLSLNDIF